MKKLRTVLIMLTFLSGVSHAQEFKEVLRNIFNDAEYWLADESYVDALAEYQKLYTRGYEDNANINYRMGICYLNIPGEKSKAIPYLEKATKDLTPRYKEGIFKETKAPYDTWLYLGNAYRINNQLDKAVEAYDNYKELSEDQETEIYADTQIESLNTAKEAMKDSVYYISDNMGDIINTSNSDYNPVVTPDEKMMAYMTSLKFYDAVKVARKVDGKWAETKQITAELEPEGKLYVNSLSKDGNTLYLNMEDNFNSDIFVSHLENGRWTKAVPLNKNINTKYWESHATISSDGEYLFLASNRKDGQGGMDIWVSRNSAEGWTEPVNLGPGINTELNEDNPFISEDGKTLYFASQGHNSIGGYDVFYSEKLADGSWAEPKNLGYPINTTDDDLFFVPVGNGKYGYQAIFNDNNIGSRDIYRFELFENKEDYLAEVASRKEPVAKQPTEETVAEPVEEPVKEPVVEPVVVPPVKPDEPSVMYVIRPVFFGFDRYDLTSEAKETLNDLVEILEAFPMLELQAVGHTDSKGSANYNLMLSRKRSASVVEYITRKGIDGRRVKSVGKGEEFPVAINANPDGSDSPEGRALNRRVEILVLKPEIPNVRVEKVEVPDNLKK